jgi:pimeloyl-ACP methyl ester carboxylesterase
MHLLAVSEGLRLAADTWGDPRCPPALLLHGGGQTRHAWGGTGSLLAAAGYFVIAYDARGHGDSQWSAQGCYSDDALVDDLRCVLACLGARHPVLIGASMGGATSLLAVGEGAVAASALVLVDIVPRLASDGVARIRSFMGQKPDGFETLEDVADAVSRYRSQRARPQRIDGLAKNLRIGVDGRYHWHWDPSFLDQPRDPVRWQQRLASSAQHLDMPTLLVRGADSDVVTDEGVRDFLALCPAAEVVRVHSAGHMVAGDRNDVFGRAALAFLVRSGRAGIKPG